MKNATVKWTGGLQFLGNADSGHAVPMDAAKDLGGGDSAARPGELILIALGGCTGIDVVNILRKMHVDFDAFEVDVKAEAAEAHPKVWKEIWVRYRVKGRVPEDKLKKAIELSSETYCSVGAMLKKSAAVHYDYEILSP